MTDHLYRVRITEYPDGSMEPVYYPGEDEPDHWTPVQGWAPPGWKPEGNYIKMLGTTEFVWPSTKPTYRSRSTAKRRAELLESFGATVVIERSTKIVWPEHPLEEDMEVLVPRPRVHAREDSVGCEEGDESPMDRLRRRLASHQ